jgi:hypothetical protein
MQAESLEVLEGADVAPAQARAIVRAIEIEIAGAKDVLATKHDLLLQSQGMHQGMTRLETGLREEMTRLEVGLHGQMTRLDKDLRGEIAALRTDMADWRGELRGEIHATASSGTRQMYMALLGQMAVLLGFAYFFATHVR